MLPSRSRLQGWNPESLAPAGSTIGNAGQSTYDTVRRLDDDCDRMPEARVWSGGAQKEAAKMFTRATDRSSNFLHYAKAVADALQTGSGRIGKARSDALSEADAIDKGELEVNDQWVVLIRPAGMTAEHAADLQKRAEAAQADLNPLVHAVDAADKDTMQQLLLARAKEGAAFKNSRQGPPSPLPPVPGNEVPDPNTDAGRQLQSMVRAQDMSTTVRDTAESTDENGNHFKTLMMLDGSKQVIKTEGGWPPSAHKVPEGTVEVTQYDAKGNVVSIAETIKHDDGSERTEIFWTDGTTVTMTRTPDGKCSGGVVTKDGHTGNLPDAFFAEPIPDIVGGSLTALEKQSEKGIPGLSAETLERVGAGAKFAGPAFGVAAAIYDVATAETKHDACVAAWKGGAGVIGGMTFDAVLTAVQPELAPVWAGVASGTAGFGFGQLGGVVGELVCPE
ncbi:MULTISPECIES: hypothetical protein [unclassified Mycobacterium]|uniref:hypothetical protein n=1 Tax=unclassified Mycobacterium TaxID=2642494 RepID=UPI0029C8E98C|nr:MULTISPECIES: hypothetical protein [unclassified Mycobacterium]